MDEQVLAGQLIGDEEEMGDDIHTEASVESQEGEEEEPEMQKQKVDMKIQQKKREGYEKPPNE